jgi:hypothetical protein
MIALKHAFRQPEPTNTSTEENSTETVRNEGVSSSKAKTEPAAELSSGKIGQLVQRMGATSIAEIETLIGHLQAARSYLQSESERIQRELARYAHLSDTASASINIITQSLGQWRTDNDSMHSGGKSAELRAD